MSLAVALPLAWVKTSASGQGLQLDPDVGCTPDGGNGMSPGTGATTAVVETAAGPFEPPTRPGATEPVSAVHGVSSNSRLWAWVLDAAPEVSDVLLRRRESEL